MSNSSTPYSDACNQIYTKIFDLVDRQVHDDIRCFLSELKLDKYYKSELVPGCKFDMGISPACMMPDAKKYQLYHAYLGQGHHIGINIHVNTLAYELTTSDGSSVDTFITSTDFSDVVGKLNKMLNPEN